MALYYMIYSGLIVHLVSIEIGCLDHFTPDTLAQVVNTCRITNRTIRSLAAPIAISCSYEIFNSRASMD